MCNRKGRRKRALETLPVVRDLDWLKGLEGYTPPLDSFNTGPTPYLLRSNGILVLEEDGLGNTSGRYVTTKVFDPPIPMNCN